MHLIQNRCIYSYPKYDEQMRNELLEEEMEIVEQVVNLGRSLRKDEKIKLRQPLQTVFIVATTNNIKKAIQAHTSLIVDELNVHAVDIVEDESQFVDVLVKPNFKKIGKTYKSHIKDIQIALRSLVKDQIKNLVETQKILLKCPSGFEVDLCGDDVEFVRVIKDGIKATTANKVTVAYDTKITEQLELEGLAREIVNKVNLERKSAGFNVDDTITLRISGAKAIEKSISMHSDYIAKEVLASSIEFNHSELPNSIVVNEMQLGLCMEKVKKR